MRSVSSPPQVMWQEQSNLYGASSSYYQNQQQEPLQFYAQPNDYYASSRPSLDGHMHASMTQAGTGFGGNIQSQGPWWTAFGAGGFEGEPPLLEGKYNTSSRMTLSLTLETQNWASTSRISGTNL